MAVADVSFAIGPGSILCLLGPNGAGKTTTVRMCATLLAPTAGSVTIDGVDAVRRPREARRHVGLVLGGDRGFYLRAGARDNLLLFAEVAGVGRARRRHRVDEVLDVVGLSERADDPVQTFSRGMRQRLHLARALLHEPTLLLLDEPTSGLDPEIAAQVRQLVTVLAARGTGILLTSHYMSEVEQLADHIIVLCEGHVVARGSRTDIAQASGVTSVTSFSTTAPVESLAEHLRRRNHQGSVEVSARHGRNDVRVPWRGSPDEQAVIGWLAKVGERRPEDLVTRSATLEESYLALVAAHGADGEG